MENRLLKEVELLSEEFNVNLDSAKRIGLASNNFLLGKVAVDVKAALCGDLISPKAEAALSSLMAIAPNNLSKPFEELLRMANGTFALALLSEELWIATDFLGARAVYYGQQDGIMVFGTSFDVVKRLLPNKCMLDTQALGEDFSFGYPLGDRTLAAEIKILRGGQYIRCHRGVMETNQCETFPVEAPAFETLERSLKESARALKIAIFDRIQSGKQQASLLSGGLDSRIIVSELVEHGQGVIAANYSLAGTQDRIYAEEFSKIAGVTLQVNELKPQPHSLSPGEVTSFSLHAAQVGLPPGKIFSGDGGGELFGFIDLNNELLRRIETEGVSGATASMIQQRASGYIAGKQFSNLLAQICLKGLDSEIRRIDFGFSARKILVAYILFDLRAHLHQYFSSLDLDAHELLLPFYDRRVINAAINVYKLDSSQIGHRFYYQLLEHLSPLIRKTIWQSYPGSLPCPASATATATTAINQWEYAKKLNRKDARRWAISLLRLMPRMRWPITLGKYQLQGIAFLAVVGLYNKSHVFKQTLKLNRYFEDYIFHECTFADKNIAND